MLVATMLEHREAVVRSSVRRMGNSSGIIIPKPLLTEIGSAPGDAVDVVVRDGALVVTPLRSDDRAGWSEAARLIGADEPSADDRAWLAFGNDGDRDLAW